MAPVEFDLERCFPSNYVAARSAFLQTVERAGATVESYHHNALGPAGEVLATDVAVLGRPDAKNALVLVSGTHGVEGLPGSGLLVAQVQSGLRPPPDADLAIMLVHALNPVGFAFKRRVNEDNIDLNRNFANFPADLPNPEYDELHDLLTMPPKGLGSLSRKIALASYLAKRGKRKLQHAVTKGQFDHPAGLFFGGNKPTWSRNTWDQIVGSLAGKERVLIVDYHTGLGRRGSGQLISPSSPTSFSRERDWRSIGMAACFGADGVRYSDEGDAVSTAVSGDLLGYTMKRGNHLAAVVLEFGTYPAFRVLEALMNENWAHHCDDPGARHYRERLVEVFSPDDRFWRRAIYQRAAAVTQAAIRGLTQEKRI